MDIKELMSEKEKIQDKLNKLENIKGDIKEAVYNKVKDDYQTKMSDIEKTIRENEKDVLVEIENVNIELTKVDQFVEQFENELEEINVRITLGDYLAEEYEDKQKELTEEIDTYKIRKDELSNKLKELEFIAPASKDNNEQTNEEFSEEIKIPLMEIETEEEDIVTGEIDIKKETDILKEDLLEEDEIIKEFGENGINDNKNEESISPIGNILQPILGEENEDTEEIVEDIESINPNLNEFFENKNEDESEENEDRIEGIVCPKCNHVNDANLMNCEKCGTELF